MDQRLYHYQYRRPRLNNPTYSSFNVGSSMTFFMNSPQANSPHGKSSYQQSYTMQNNSSYYRTQPRETPSSSSDIQRDRAQSNLSNYGNNSLAFNQREIYNKQHSKFNIISLKPREVPDQIKQYPKLTLEDKDDFYYKKMQKMRDFEMANSSVRSGSMPSHQENGGGSIAGKHTFVPEENKNSQYYQHGRYFTPKMLNHADQVSHIM